MNLTADDIRAIKDELREEMREEIDARVAAALSAAVGRGGPLRCERCGDPGAAVELFDYLTCVCWPCWLAFNRHPNTRDHRAELELATGIVRWASHYRPDTASMLSDIATFNATREAAEEWVKAFLEKRPVVEGEAR